MSYFVYIVRHAKSITDPTSKMYVGCSNSTNENYNPINFFIKKAKETAETDTPRYQKLYESINKYGKKNHSTVITNFKNLEKEKAEKVVYDILVKLDSDRVLNDVIINPERYTCEFCGKVLKKIYKDRHEELYCVNKVNDELAKLVGESYGF